MSQDPADIYLKYTQLVNEAGLNIDPISKALLDRIALNPDASMTVSDVLQMKDIASPATLHARMKWLVDESYLKIVGHDVDGRIKYLTLGSTGISFYNKLSQLILKASQKN